MTKIVKLYGSGRDDEFIDVYHALMWGNSAKGHKTAHDESLKRHMDKYLKYVRGHDSKKDGIYVYNLCVLLLMSKHLSRRLQNEDIRMRAQDPGNRAFIRIKSRHTGAQFCLICQIQLCNLLSKVSSMDLITKRVQSRHPEIGVKYIRDFTKRMIRDVTGLGYFDDYALTHNLWSLKHPVRAPPALRELLDVRFQILATLGHISNIFNDGEMRKVSRWYGQLPLPRALEMIAREGNACKVKR